MIEIRANEKGKSLLDFVVQVIDSKKPQALDLKINTLTLKSASQVSLQNLTQDYNELKRGMEQIENEVKNANNDNFGKYLNTFLNSEKATWSSFSKRYTEMTESFKQLVQYFGEESVSTPETIFGTMITFFDQLERCKRALAVQPMTKRVEQENAKKIKPATVKMRPPPLPPKKANLNLQ